MPKRNDLKCILLIGSGPIVIGQACEFDYSGTQACKALKEEGYRVVLINSNPATIMTDPDLVDATYIEPITVKSVEAIIKKEKPDAILPTMGGQTALNMAILLDKAGIFKKYNVELIGASIKAINKAEDRQLFANAMNSINLKMPLSCVVHTVEEAYEVSKDISFPLIIRPSFTLGGEGGGIAQNKEQLKTIVSKGLNVSPTHEVLVEQSVWGWKEYELEVMRDCKDNVVIICSIENLDPMGVHTGDSITVAPQQTLSDKEYQKLRDSGLDIIREIGVDTGGSNIQFAINPADGEILIIEMNPRVSRSSALASKATGFPIAKIAAKLAIGYTLDEIPNDITKMTPASFEPTIDYVVTKIPRFTFEKFPFADKQLNTQMKSVGEVMAIGRTFKESFQKALRSLETGHTGLNEVVFEDEDKTKIMAQIHQELKVPTSDRIWYVGEALRRGMSVEEVHELSYIDPWFLNQINTLIEVETEIKKTGIDNLNAINLKRFKQLGFGDERLSELLGVEEAKVTLFRKKQGIKPVFKLVDTCAAEFDSKTPYFYSTYEDQNESLPNNAKKVIILGSGPNRIGQGIEFDYCCVHAAMAIGDLGYESIMINCNPETVSTDYDTSDRLYFEPICFEDVMHIIELENPIGVIVQLGGQTPLKLAKRLQQAGVNLLGTPFESIDRAEDRELFSKMVQKLGLNQPPNGMAFSVDEAKAFGGKLGFPILVRPSYVLGGRAMVIVHNQNELVEYFQKAVKVSPKHPVLIDKFLEGATEVDIDVIADGKQCEIAGIMEHIEQAGIHSGDSACSLPPFSLNTETIGELTRQSFALATELKVVGLMNVQYAIKEGKIYLIEVNPRASRTVPFVSKAILKPIAKFATRLMLGESLDSLNYKYEVPDLTCVKETVFPFSKFSDTDTELGPEMKSTGEVMGRGKTFDEAYLKSQAAVFHEVPQGGNVFIGVLDKDKKPMVPLAKMLVENGFSILATKGTYDVLAKAGVKNVKITNFLSDQADEDNVQNYIFKKELSLIINTTKPRQRAVISGHLRRLTLLYNLPYCTTVEAATNFVTSLCTTKMGEQFSYATLKD